MTHIGSVGSGLGAIDVLVAAWNRGDTIERAVLSAVADPAVRTVIVIDDASTDDTAARVAALAESNGKVKILRQARNGGPSAARNLGLANSDAPWIAILDGDDYVVPGRFSLMLSMADGWDLVADDHLQLREGAAPETARRLLGTPLPWPEHIDLKIFVEANISQRGQQRKELGFLKPIIRREFLDRFNLRYDETVRLGEDYLLYARALAHGARFRLIAEAGYVSVMRSDSLSGRHGRTDLEALLTGDLDLSRISSLTTTERHALKRHQSHLAEKIEWLIVIEAVKGRDWHRLIKCFAVSTDITISLIGRLLEQAWLRASHGLTKLSRRSR